MNDGIRLYFRQLLDAWNRFWFTPRNATTICVMRVMVGVMLVYTHLVWTLELSTFFSESGVFPNEYQAAFTGNSPFVWSHFHWLDSPTWMWASHVLCLIVLATFAIGLWTRWTGILAFLIVVSYANRAGGALFGLDQVNGFLTLYLAISPCGSRFSVDSWLRKRRGQGSEEESPTTMANVSTRLIQLHLCVVYLFAGLGKLQGVSWWDGTALWGAFASYEYQTLDMTWMVHLPWLVNLITLLAVFWELSYPFMVWPKLTRPIYLILAAMVHLGIGMAMGMITFGLIMLVANLSFVSPRLLDGLLGRLTRASGSSGTTAPESS